MNLRAAHLLLVLALAMRAFAENGYDGWLRYAELPPEAQKAWRNLPAITVAPGNSEMIEAVREEWARGIRGMLQRTTRFSDQLPKENVFLFGTLSNLLSIAPGLPLPKNVEEDGYWIGRVRRDGRELWIVTAPSERGALYGVFALLRKIALGERKQLEAPSNPAATWRVLNHWDNLNGTIERGYAGSSIFWANDHIVPDLTRIRDYARLMASLGINGCSINNVNADARVVTSLYLQEIARVAAVFRPWGVKLFLSLDFASPRRIGKIDTFDPLDPRAVEFWKKTIDGVYAAVPDLGGFILKADSEGRLGPSEYGRTHADAANVIARALQPHGGVLFYRGFVYNHKMDWRDRKLDRARAAYDNFARLDGRFETNVIIQIKHGPIDFQVREPASPLFGALEKTATAIELQITAEYLGQQRHVCYVAPMWKAALDFDLDPDRRGRKVKEVVARRGGGFAGVSNVGSDTNWLGHHLAMANLYAFGRLAWNPDLASEEIATEWTRLTFGSDPQTRKSITKILNDSWAAYENYTGPLGAGTLTDIINIHYGPAVESSEYNGWGQWHRADTNGIGMDRTAATGTGFISQYSPRVAAIFESLSNCPDELLLFLHHVPYTHRLHSGKTVIQHIYDSHYRGAEQAAEFVEIWKSLRGRVDEQRYDTVLAQLEYQAGHAVVWRDAICNWFLAKSGIPDERGRAGTFPGRIEAESMRLEGYERVEIAPWETASGGAAVQMTNPGGEGAISFNYAGADGLHDIIIQYFDENDGASAFKLLLNGQDIDRWAATGSFPTHLPDGHSSARRKISNVPLRAGDELRILGKSDGKEKAVVDYIEISASKN